MSQFVRIATQLTEAEAIQEAAEELGYTVLAEQTEVRGYSSRTAKAEFVLGTDTRYDIGAVRGEDGRYEFVSDWSMSRIDRQDFVNRLSQGYSRIRVVRNAKKRGFQVATEKVDEKGNVRLLLRKFV